AAVVLLSTGVDACVDAVYFLYHADFASCVLLLTLSWRTSTGLPVCTLSEDQCEHCSSLFNSLLLNVKDLLNKNNSAVLCYGISSDRAVVKSKADTVLACAPTQSSGCMMQRNSPFSELECRRNIMKDLAHYAAAFESYINSSLRCPEKEIPLLKPTLGIIQSLRKDCCLMPNGERDSSEVFFYSFFFVCSLFAPHLSVFKMETDTKDAQGS
uniref:Interleukin 12A n=1 Tax=Dicentrarchus labrax TaxID=13489 RepID=A0A8P4K9Y1_DICLA